MIDISHKTKTLRTATAQATLKLSASTLALIREQKIPKGNPFEVAKVAAVQAAKNTSQIIPYCHPLPIDFVGVEYNVLENRIEINVTVKAIYKTGVEMEALTAASVAALTIYDMTKMFDEEMEIVGVKLLKKTGGKSDFKEKFSTQLRAAVLVLSDSISSGKGEDVSGKIIAERLEGYGLRVASFKVIADEKEKIELELKNLCDKEQVDLIITTGGTGVSPRDVTPEATLSVIERRMEGVEETLRNFGQERTPFSMLSRGVIGIRGKTIIVNFPGSAKGVEDSLNAIFPALFHSFKMMKGERH